jgi:hypothetical protein
MFIGKLTSGNDQLVGETDRPTGSRKPIITSNRKSAVQRIVEEVTP